MTPKSRSSAQAAAAVFLGAKTAGRYTPFAYLVEKKEERPSFETLLLIIRTPALDRLNLSAIPRLEVSDCAGGGGDSPCRRSARSAASTFGVEMSTCE